MRWKLPGLSRRWLILPPILLGVAVTVTLVRNRERPLREPDREQPRVLRVIAVEPLDVVPRAVGYGTAQPGQIWRAVSEVRGRVIEVHPQLEPGAMVRQGDVLLRIDPAEYQLGIAQIEADIAQVKAQLEELTVKEANDRDSLEIEQSSLALAERELQRLQSLRERNATSESAIDQQNRAVLTQRQNVQKLQNSLQLVPHQRKSLEAALAVKQAGLEQAELDLAKTTIAAPLDCRLGEVDIEPGQFLAVGQSLFEAHGIGWAEVEIQLPMDQLRTLIHPDHSVPLPVQMDPSTIEQLFDFDVTVRYRSGDFQPEWKGRVLRLREQLDPRTRTIGLVIAVDKPYEQAIPGQRPPLVQGMYCEAELRGRVRAGQIVIPRAALHDGQVYIVDQDNRLQRRSVQVAFAQSSFLCIQSGLRAGDRVVVSDPTPAITGGLVEPVPDSPLRQRLAAEAAGEGEAP